jgi:autotransporter passenger strand-loop-strand repeat protein
MSDGQTTILAPIVEKSGWRQFSGPLFRKYVGLFLAVVCVALLSNGLFEIIFSYREHTDALVRIQREQAEGAAEKISQFIREIENQMGWTTQLTWSASTIEQRRFDGLRLLRQVPAITELARLDSAGKEQLRVSRLAMDLVGEHNGKRYEMNAAGIGKTSDTVVKSQGIELVISGGETVGTIVNKGGQEVVFDGTATGTVISGGTLELAVGGAASGGITFAGTGGTLKIDGTTVPSTVIGGFVKGNSISSTLPEKRA